MKTALITGGAARIGAQIVKTLHHNQFNIIIHCNQSKDKAQLLCDELNLIRANSVEIVSGNLNNIDELDSLVSSIKSIDLLCMHNKYYIRNLKYTCYEKTIYTPCFNPY